MNLKKILLIAKREYMTNFRRRAFLFTAFLVPLFTLVMTGVVTTLAARAEVDMGDVKVIGIVDQAHVLTDSSGSLLVTPTAPFQIMDEATAASKLARGDIQGFYVIGADYLSKGVVNSVSRESLPGGLQNALDNYLTQSIAARAGNPDLTARLSDPLANEMLYRTDRPGVPVDNLALVGAFLVPFIFGLLIYMASTTTSQFLMSGVAEEKENRMMELLVTSVRPSELLWGKLLGLGALGLSQILIWAAVGLIFAELGGTVNLARTLSDLQITPGYLAIIAVYFALSYLLTGSIMATLGVMGDNEQEGRQLAGVVALPAILPFIFMFAFISNPNGTLPVIFSLFPLTAPLSMIFRLTWGTVPPEQIAISLGILAVSVLLAVGLSARIFRMGMLSYGKRLNLRDIIAALREGRQHIITTDATKGAS